MASDSKKEICFTENLENEEIQKDDREQYEYSQTNTSRQLENSVENRKLLEFLNFKMNAGQYDEIIEILKQVELATEKIFLKIWDEAHYKVFQQKFSIKKLTSCHRFRIRKRHPPPSGICQRPVKPSLDGYFILKKWFEKNINHLYPSRQMKQNLAIQTGKTYMQVSNWFANARRKRRILQNKQNETSGHHYKSVQVQTPAIKHENYHGEVSENGEDIIEENENADQECHSTFKALFVANNLKDVKISRSKEYCNNVIEQASITSEQNGDLPQTDNASNVREDTKPETNEQNGELSQTDNASNVREDTKPETNEQNGELSQTDNASNVREDTRLETNEQNVDLPQTDNASNVREDTRPETNEQNGNLLQTDNASNVREDTRLETSKQNVDLPQTDNATNVREDTRPETSEQNVDLPQTDNASNVREDTRLETSEQNGNLPQTDNASNVREDTKPETNEQNGNLPLTDNASNVREDARLETSEQNGDLPQTYNASNVREDTKPETNEQNGDLPQTDNASNVKEDARLETSEQNVDLQQTGDASNVGEDTRLATSEQNGNLPQTDIASNVREDTRPEKSEQNDYVATDVTCELKNLPVTVTTPVEKQKNDLKSNPGIPFKPRHSLINSQQGIAFDSVREKKFNDCLFNKTNKKYQVCKFKRNENMGDVQIKKKQKLLPTVFFDRSENAKEIDAINFLKSKREKFSTRQRLSSIKSAWKLRQKLKEKKRKENELQSKYIDMSNVEIHDAGKSLQALQKLCDDVENTTTLLVDFDTEDDDSDTLKIVSDEETDTCDSADDELTTADDEIFNKQNLMQNELEDTGSRYFNALVVTSGSRGGSNNRQLQDSGSRYSDTSNQQLGPVGFPLSYEPVSPMGAANADRVTPVQLYKRSYPKYVAGGSEVMPPYIQKVPWLPGKRITEDINVPVRWDTGRNMSTPLATELDVQCDTQTVTENAGRCHMQIDCETVYNGQSPGSADWVTIDNAESQMEMDFHAIYNSVGDMPTDYVTVYDETGHMPADCDTVYDETDHMPTDCDTAYNETIHMPADCDTVYDAVRYASTDWANVKDGGQCVPADYYIDSTVANPYCNQTPEGSALDLCCHGYHYYAQENYQGNTVQPLSQQFYDTVVGEAIQGLLTLSSQESESNSCSYETSTQMESLEESI